MSHIVGANELVKKETCNKNIDKVMNEIKDVHKEVGDVKDSVSDLHVKIAKLPEAIMEKADLRYASKLSEKLVYGMVAIVLTSVISSLVYVVVRPNNEINNNVANNAREIQEIKDLILEAME